jgi:NADPH-dependent 2,4-dienoyl-CoA reductase/sulfur reductase-like enzyme
LVNEHLETSAPDIFAAGDAAEMRDSVSGATWFEMLWRKARQQGEVAGANMAGIRTVCTRSILYNAVRIGGIATTTIGSVQRSGDQTLLTVAGSGDDLRRASFPARGIAPEAQASRVRVLVGERTLVGAVVMGDQSMARPLLHLIEGGADITSIRPALQKDPARGFELIARLCANAEAFGVKAQP